MGDFLNKIRTLTEVRVAEAKRAHPLPKKSLRIPHDFAAQDAPVFEREIERILRGDLDDALECHGHRAREIRFHHESLAVRLHDGAREPVAVREHDLIGESGRAEQKKRERTLQMKPPDCEWATRPA